MPVIRWQSCSIFGLNWKDKTCGWATDKRVRADMQAAHTEVRRNFNKQRKKHGLLGAELPSLKGNTQTPNTLAQHIATPADIAHPRVLASCTDQYIELIERFAKVQKCFATRTVLGLGSILFLKSNSGSKLCKLAVELDTVLANKTEFPELFTTEQGYDSKRRPYVYRIRRVFSFNPFIINQRLRSGIPVRMQETTDAQAKTALSLSTIIALYF